MGLCSAQYSGSSSAAAVGAQWLGLLGAEKGLNSDLGAKRDCAGAKAPVDLNGLMAGLSRLRKNSGLRENLKKNVPQRLKPSFIL